MTVKLSGGRLLSYTIHGDPKGIPLIWNHGNPGSSLDRFPDNDIAKSRGVRVIGVDRPGYGFSTNTYKYSYAQYTKDIGELLDALKIDIFVTLGFSSGGTYAHAIAHDFPKKCLFYIIISGDGPYDVMPQKLWHGNEVAIHNLYTKQGEPGVEKGFALRMRKRYRKDVDAYMAIEFGGLWRKGDKVMRDMLRSSYHYAFSTGDFCEDDKGNKYSGFGLDILVEFCRFPWGFSLKDIKVPCYMWHGLYDKLVKTETAEYVSKNLGNCKQLLFVPHGHALYLKEKRWTDIMQLVKDKYTLYISDTSENSVEKQSK